MVVTHLSLINFNFVGDKNIKFYKWEQSFSFYQTIITTLWGFLLTIYEPIYWRSTSNFDLKITSWRPLSNKQRQIHMGFEISLVISNKGITKIRIIHISICMIHIFYVQSTRVSHYCGERRRAHEVFAIPIFKKN